MEWTDEANSLPKVKDIEVTTKSGKFYMIIDERWNQLFFTHTNDLSQIIHIHEWSEEMSFLNSEWIELKSSDFRYKIEPGIEGTQKIFLKTFINHLRTKSRDILINKIIQHDN
jgi:penicillin-binding protein-related factor A (putative recombinase)